MHLIYTLFIALSNNLDNISVRIAYCIRGIKISIKNNLWISAITLVISSLAAFGGKILTGFINKNVSSIISMLLFVAIGAWIILEPYLKKKTDIDVKLENSSEISVCDILKQPESADIDNSKDIDFKEATFLGIALSVNNISGGFSAGMIRLNPFLIGLLSAIISFLALWAGNYITDFLSKWGLEKKANNFAGIMLIIIGIKQII